MCWRWGGVALQALPGVKYITPPPLLFFPGEWMEEESRMPWGDPGWMQGGKGTFAAVQSGNERKEKELEGP